MEHDFVEEIDTVNIPLEMGRVPEAPFLLEETLQINGCEGEKVTFFTSVTRVILPITAHLITLSGLHTHTHTQYRWETVGEKRVQ